MPAFKRLAVAEQLVEVAPEESAALGQAAGDLLDHAVAYYERPAP